MFLWGGDCSSGVLTKQNSGVRLSQLVSAAWLVLQFVPLCRCSEATVPNYKDFAGWVGRTKQRPVCAAVFVRDGVCVCVESSASVWLSKRMGR